MTEQCTFSLVCFVLFLQAIICRPGQVRIPRNEIQYPNGTVVGGYSCKDTAGNPISVKYYADKKGYGVELNSFKTFKLFDGTTTKADLQNAKPDKDSIEPMTPLLDLAAEILNFDKKFTNETNEDGTAKHSATFSHVQHISKLTKGNHLYNPDYEKFYQNEVKAPKQCEKDKVKVYLAKEKRKKKNAVDNAIIKATTNK